MFTELFGGGREMGGRDNVADDEDFWGGFLDRSQLVCLAQYSLLSKSKAVVLLAQVWREHTKV